MSCAFPDLRQGSIPADGYAAVVLTLFDLEYVQPIAVVPAQVNIYAVPGPAAHHRLADGALLAYEPLGRVLAQGGHQRYNALALVVLGADGDVVVQASPRVYKALRGQLSEVLDELKRIDNGRSVNDGLLETINLIAQILNGLKGDLPIDN